MAIGSYAINVLLLVQLIQSDVLNAKPCNSMPYLELGKSGIINCSFAEPFFGVYWYNLSSDIPIIFYQESIKGGIGYTTNEFDIFPSGSLKINAVTLQHENKFTVEYLSSTSSVPVEFDVNIIVYVKPTPSFPFINGCSNATNGIYFTQMQNQQIHCSLNDVRPNISLSWMKRTSFGDAVIPYEQFVSPGHTWYTSHATTFPPYDYSLLLQLLVCKVEKPSGLFERDESLILVQHSEENISITQPTTRLVELHSRLELRCAESMPLFIVWKRSRTSNKEMEVLWYVASRGKPATEAANGDYSFGVSGNLEIPRIEVQHEGLYACLFGDGFSAGWTKYKVDVYVNPVPHHLIIDGCNPNQYCVLEVGRSGNLTCTVRGIYPKVELEMKPFYKNAISEITFTSHELTSKRDGDTFQISIHSTYEMKDMSLNKITITCQAAGINADRFNLNTKLDLLFVTASEEPVTVQRNKWLWTPHLALILSFSVIVASVVIATTVKKYKLEQREEHETEPSLIELAIRDFSPKEMATRQMIFKVMEDCFKSHGAETIGTPVIENERDINNKYSSRYSQKITYLQDKSFALRFDHTVPLLRYIIDNNITDMKRYQIASVFRKNNKKDGRCKELYQCDFDIVGKFKSVIPDAECLEVVTDVLRKLGFENFVTKVSHQKLLEGLFQACDVPDHMYANLVLYMENNLTVSWETFKENLTKVESLSSVKADKLVAYLTSRDCDQLLTKLVDSQKPITDNIKEGRDQLQQLLEYCEILGVRDKVQVDFRVACALGFYTGVVFKTVLIKESNSNVEENVNPTQTPRLVSGGRYDPSESMLAGKAMTISCVGFSFYFEEIFSSFKSKQDLRTKETELFITSDEEEHCIKEKIKLCKQSWDAGINAEMTYDTDSAHCPRYTEGIRFIVQIRQSEIQKGLVTLKDTATKEEISIETSKVTEHVRKRLK